MEFLTTKSVSYKRAASGGIGRRPAAQKANGSSARVRVGIASVFGNVDAAGDVVTPDAFRKAINDFNAGRTRIRLLWNHDAEKPPIGSIRKIEQLTRADLPASLRSNPEVTGGLLVEREYYRDIDLSEWVLKGLDAGDITEMSFAFNVVKATPGKRGDKNIRVLEEMEIYDISDVLWGCNAGTIAVISKSFPPPVSKSRISRPLDSERWLQVARLQLDALRLDSGLPKTSPRRKSLLDQQRDAVNRLRLEALKI